MILGTGLCYTGDPRDIMRGQEDPEKFIRLFEPKPIHIDDKEYGIGDDYELIYTGRE